MMLLVNGIVMLALVTVAAEDKKEASTDGKDFVAKAFCCNETEIKLGKLAADKAENSEVKAFAEMMVRDHTKAQEELKKVCKEAKLECPTEQTKEGKECCDKLEKTEKGKEFDKAYMQTQIKLHDKAVKTLEQASKEGPEAVREFAKKMLPTVQDHQKKAKEIASKIGAES
ncbi:MAG: DUF4142 domain-containing protein [Gemmataceae bacterium]|nr:DUF4142 domain-containing protein [Gemmataceae bacterium]